MKYSSHASGHYLKKWQPKVGFWGYDILFAHFVVEAKSKIVQFLVKFSVKLCSQSFCTKIVLKYVKIFKNIHKIKEKKYPIFRNIRKYVIIIQCNTTVFKSIKKFKKILKTFENIHENFSLFNYIQEVSCPLYLRVLPYMQKLLHLFENLTWQHCSHTICYCLLWFGVFFY